MKLPYSLDAVKPLDTNTPKYRSMLQADGYPPEMAVELDALPPATLEHLVREAIEANLDMSLFAAEQKKAENDRMELMVCKQQVLQALGAA